MAETQQEFMPRSRVRLGKGASGQEYEARMRFLDQVPLLKRLPKDEHPIVAEACEACEFQNGDVIIQQGGERCSCGFWAVFGYLEAI